jgi:Flp pilus assembly protein TadB
MGAVEGRSEWGLPMFDIAALSVMLIAVLFFGTLLVAAWRHPAEEPRRAAHEARASASQATQPASAPATAAAPAERPQPAKPARSARRPQPRREEAARRRTSAAAFVVLGAGLALPAATA